MTATKRTDKQKKSLFNHLPMNPPKDWKAPPCQLPNREQCPITPPRK